MVLDSTGFNSAWKILYPKGLTELLYPKVPAIGWMNKSTDFYGDQKAIVPFFGGGNGSTKFSSALANKSDVKLTRFLVTRVKDYAIFSIDAETVLASSNDKGAVAKALDTQIRGHMYHMARSAGFQIYSDGSGRRGQGDGSWTVSGNVITLADPRTVVHFETGMVLQFESTGGTLRSGTVTLSKVNRDTTTATLTTVESDISAAVGSVANDDHILRAGDKDNCAAGFKAWIPATVTSTPFFQVDRTQDSVRLGGQRYTARSSVLEEVFINAAAEGMVNGASFDTCFLHPLRLAQMNKSQYAKTKVEVNSTTSGIKYKAISMMTGSGDVNFIPDPNCDYDIAWLLTKSSWELCSLREFPHFAMDDGKKFERDPTIDGFGGRIRAYWNVLCDNPMQNMRVDLSAA